MKRALTICGVFCALMIGVAAVSAQKGANFAGTWELDKSKSKLPEQMASNLTSLTWTVTQTDAELKVEPKAEMAQGGGGGRGMMGGNQPSSYKLDGSETTTDLTGRMTGKVTRKAKWAGEGKILELNAVTNADFNGNAFTSTMTEHWELADGGKTLKVHRKSENPRGTQESTYVFTKK
ncbi:MAG: hypothetical protein ACREAB_17330 [Blastocatellia bacterium]